MYPSKCHSVGDVCVCLSGEGAERVGDDGSIGLGQEVRGTGPGAQS